MGNTTPQSLTLYYAPKTRSIRPLWVLEEIGTPYDCIELDLGAGEHKRPDYLKIHPFGKVPALVADGEVMYESLAICLYLADAFPQSDLAPAADAGGRVDYLQWMAFSIGTFEPAFMAVSAGHETNVTMTDLNLIGKILDNHLADRPFILGDTFSAADILNGSLARWALQAGSLGEYANIQRWVDELHDRPAWRRVADR